MENLIIIAHRGASFDAPENTLASVHLAWTQNINFVEVDVKLTKDNVLVVFHDETTIRFNQVNKRISEYTFKELSTIDVGLFKGEKWKNESIPSLEQVLKTIRETIEGTRIEMTFEEVKILWPKVNEFVNTNKREPDINSLNPKEKRLAETIIFLKREKRKISTDG